MTFITFCARLDWHGDNLETTSSRCYNQISKPKSSGDYTMKHFTCDACHYIFQSDDIPSSCPACNAASVIAYNSTNRKFKISAVRISTEAEAKKNQQANREESAQKSFLERVDSLTGYTLTDDEYHTALMLLFYFKSTPDNFISIHLGCILSQGNPSTENEMDGESARDLYTCAQKHFASQLGRERHETGCNDATEAATYTEKGSASSLLIQFRQTEWDQILGKVPNLANIRNVKIEQVAKRPGEDYLRFLMDWYNSILD